MPITICHKMGRQKRCQQHRTHTRRQLAVIRLGQTLYMAQKSAICNLKKNTSTANATSANRRRSHRASRGQITVGGLLTPLKVLSQPPTQAARCEIERSRLTAIITNVIQVQARTHTQMSVRHICACLHLIPHHTEHSNGWRSHGNVVCLVCVCVCGALPRQPPGVARHMETENYRLIRCAECVCACFDIVWVKHCGHGIGWNGIAWYAVNILMWMYNNNNDNMVAINAACTPERRIQR